MEIFNYLGTLLSGFGVTLRLTLLSFGGAVIFGTVLAAMRVSPIVPLRAAGSIFVGIFQNIPLMSLIILVVYALPELSITMSFETSVITAMICVGSAFLCEVLRSGINGIPVGQIEAARSLGFSFRGILSQIVLPQAFRSMVGPLANVFIAILLSSSLAGVVGVGDLTQRASWVGSRTAGGMLTFALSAMIYLLLSLLIGAGGSFIEKRVRVNR